MIYKNPSSKTFSNDSFSNWQSKKCQFCMYKQLICEQLQRLKQAVQLKNKRIKELESFIKKISQMAFINNSLQSSHIMSMNSNLEQSNLSANNNYKQSIGIQAKLMEQKENLQNYQHMMSKRQQKNVLKQRKFQDPTQISFRDSIQNNIQNNTGKFNNINIRPKQYEHEQLNSRFNRINELNMMKKQIQKRLIESQSKNNSMSMNKDKYFVNNHGNSMGHGNHYFFGSKSIRNQSEYDTLRTLSEPQEEGCVGSIQYMNDESNRTNQLSMRKNSFDDIQRYNKSESLTALNTPENTNRQNKNPDKSSIDIIKSFLKNIK